MICVSCGRANDGDARFCAACGAPLVSRPGGAETRKVVTVVFTDVAGSTALGERLDPESLRRVMWRYFDTMQATLERHGGTVEKFIGDAVVAVFGVPVRARGRRPPGGAGSVRDAGRARPCQRRARSRVRRPPRDANRASTPARWSSAQGRTTQKLATGDAVNVAARLEQAAREGEVLVGEATYRLVRDAVVAEPTAPVEAKGKSRPLAAWRVLGVRPDVPAFARPIQTPFVGRGAELGDVRHAFESAVRESTCTLATIVGSARDRQVPPRPGGTSLVRAGGARARRPLRRLRGRHHISPACGRRPRRGRDRPGARSRRSCSRTSSAGTSRRASSWPPSARTTSPDLPRRRRGPSGDSSRRSPLSRPLVVAVDDIHWAEPTLLDLLEYVLGFSGGAPILLLCLARPDLFDTRPSWAAPRPRTSLVTLSALSPAESAALVEGLVHDEPVPPALRDRIVGAADGNPLFVEQMLAMLADDPDAADEAVPAGIHALLAARIDRLEPGERAVLQRASVEGRLFHRAAVAELLPEGTDGLGGTLLALTRKELVRPDRSLYEGDDGFRFTHVLVRDVAYASVPKELRAELHARLASWLEAHEGTQLTGQEEIVGYHLEQAYANRLDLGRVDDDARAVALRGGMLLGRAGRRALDRDEFGAAATLLERACRLLEVEPTARAALLTDLGRALRGTGALNAADDALAEAIEDARRGGDEPTELRAEMERAHLTFMRALSDPDSLRRVAERAVAVFERLGSDADLADAWQLMGLAELEARNRGAQLVALRRGREHAISSGDLRRQIEAWNEVGGAMIFGRTPLGEVLAFVDEELAWARERGLPAVEADALLGGPYVYARLGRFDEARERLERSKAICRELGIAYGLAEAHMAGSEMEMLAGDAAAAERELRDAISVASEMGASRYIALYRTRLAHVLVALGRDRDALAELEASRAVYGDAPKWKAAHARVLALRGQTAEAATLARDAAGFMEGNDDVTARAEILVDLAEVLRAHGDAAGAAGALAEALALHEEKGNLVAAEHCRRLLADLPIGGPAPTTG